MSRSTVFLAAILALAWLTVGCSNACQGRIAYTSRVIQDEHINIIDLDSHESYDLSSRFYDEVQDMWPPLSDRWALHDDHSPTWSPDGTRIAFVTSRFGGAIHVMRDDGSTPVPMLGDANSYDPDWGPDGIRVAYTSGYPDWQIYVWNIANSHREQLTSNNAFNDHPDWSPDGNRIAFRSGRDDDSDIYVMNSDGTAVRNLTTDSDSMDLAPDWSPDGSQIAFASYRSGNADIYIMNANGSNVVQLTRSEANDFDPAWSPDGKQIAFDSDRDGDHEIYVMDSDGTNVTQLTSNLYDDYRPAWDPSACN